MNFEKYTELVTWFFENDNREVNYQNRVLIPFWETLCTDFDVVDTSMLTKEWDKRNIERRKFAGFYTPDLLIASNWKLQDKSEKVEYKSLIEIKTPTAQDRDHAEEEVKEYLEKVSFVVLTDCVTWEFYMKENEQIYYSCYSLEQEPESTVCNSPAQVCKREGKASIIWSDKDWKKINKIISRGSIDKEKAAVINI